ISVDGIRDQDGSWQGGGRSSYWTYSGLSTTQPGAILARIPRPWMRETRPVVRADRLLSLLSLLQVHGRLSATDLARRLEVSTRTVYRDIEALSASGVPVYTEQGRRGGCVLLPGYRTDVSGLTSAEARALFTFTGRGLGMDADLKAALRKLLAQLPEPQRPEALHAQSSVVVDPRGWRRVADQTPHLDTVQTVVRQGKRLRMNYRGSERTVDPYGLVAKA